jgi:hypothetical protein
VTTHGTAISMDYFNERRMDMGTAGNHLKCDPGDFNPQVVSEYSEGEIEW